MSKEIFDVPTFCPLGCGKTLQIQKVSGPCKEYLKNTRTTTSKDHRVDLNQSYGILCSSCGYATTILGLKKD